MILGTGIDLVDIQRIENLLNKYGNRFIERYFTEYEAERAASFNVETQKLLSLAKRFAAKEACAKALGTGFREGIYMKDMEIRNDALGKPSLSLKNGALAQLNAMTPDNMKACIYLSMTDEPPYAQAQVIIEAL